jgi:hypothetical protein
VEDIVYARGSISRHGVVRQVALQEFDAAEHLGKIRAPTGTEVVCNSYPLALIK